MRRFWTGASTFALVASLIALFAGGTFAGDHQFVGAAKCKICHKAASAGAQYIKWQESKHSKAFETLAGDAAKAIAKEKGIADPQKADECLKCHVTGHGAKAELQGKKYDASKGVWCESCHGAGGDYSKRKTMVGVTDGSIDAASVGLVMPDEATCKKCHNEASPSFKGFKFDEMFKKIAHPMPDARRAKYKKD